MSIKEEKQMKILKKVVTVIIMIILCGTLFASGVILINSYIRPNEVPTFFLRETIYSIIRFNGDTNNDRGYCSRKRC